jgi:hypothetical protein
MSYVPKLTAVSHIPQFEDAITYPAGDVDVSTGDAHLQISGYVTLLQVDESGGRSRF